MLLSNRPLFWIARLSKRRAAIRPALVSGAHSAAGHPARTTSGLAAAATSGTPSTREECAPLASTSGLRRSASRAPSGRRTRSGMRGDLMMAAWHSSVRCQSGSLWKILSGRRPNVSGTAADAVPMPKAKPRAMRVHLVVPSIHSREVTRAQRSGVRHGKDAL
jgi:hypothetical protein